MKDDLEKFILNNRSEMDEHDPGDALWAKLEKKLDQAKPARQVRVVPVTRVWQVAASFALIIAAMGIFQWQYNRQLQGQQQAAAEVTIDRLAPELAEAEHFYIAQIKQKQTELDEHDLKALGMEQDFEHDLSALDSMYKDLKTELKNSGNQEAVISAMIQNMQMRIEILNQQLELLEKIKNVKKQKDNGKTVIL